MSYQVIARKWRPQTFDEVTGQEPVTRTLRNSIAHGRLHHAYLFSGARGVGKTTTARLLAKAVNCRRSDAPTPTPCRADDPDACVSCREIAEGRSIDVLEIDAASNTQVEKTREVIINNIGIAPARDRYKVFIIDEVHMLSTSSFNALLKTLEEPPPRVLFIMATTEQHRLPDTILSRCQQFEFRTIAAAKISERLRLIADAEGVAVTDEALREIARAGEGSMRDAQSAFDQVISFSGVLFDVPTETVSRKKGAAGEDASGGAKVIDAEDVEAALGIAGAEVLARVVRAIAEEKPAEMLAVVDELVMRGHDLRNFCRDLLAHLRDLLVFKVAGDSAAFSDASATERRPLAEAVRDFSESDLVRFFHSLTETERQLRESVHPRYQLEIGLVKLVEMRRLAPLSKIVERLNALEESLRTGKLTVGGPGSENGPAESSGGRSSRGGAASSGGNTASFGDSAAIAAHTPVVAETFAAAETFVPAETFTAAPQRHAPAEPRSAQPSGAAMRSSEEGDPAPRHSRDERPASDLAGEPPVLEPVGDVRPQAPNVSAQARSNDRQGSVFGAGRAALSGHANLKLVSSPSNSASVANVAAAPVTDAPFPLDGDEAPFPFGGDKAPAAPPRPLAAETFPEVKAGEDRIGEPIALRRPVASMDVGAGFEGAAAKGHRAEPFEEASGLAGLIRGKLEARNKPLLAMAVDGARRVRVDGEEVRVEFPPESRHLREMLNKPEALKLLREVCCEAVGHEVGVRTELRAPGAGDEEPLTPEEEERLERRLLRERAEQSPAMRQVLKTFRAEIIDVRLAEDAQSPAS
jgi:DNA polymerase-3 subunit gamma/tau